MENSNGKNGGSDPAMGDDLDDTDDTSVEDDGIEIELEPMPLEIAELCAALVRFVSTKYKFELDFSPDTLSVLDAYVRDARKEVQAKPESLDLLQASIGAYFGEVIRRVYCGMWTLRSATPAKTSQEGSPAEGTLADEDSYGARGWRLGFQHIFLEFNPVGAAREWLLEDHADGWAANFRVKTEDDLALHARIDVIPPVEEDAFFLPTTRCDVLELVGDFLIDRRRQRGETTLFTRAHYLSLPN